MKAAIGWIWRVLLWMLILGVAAVITVAVLLPRAGGGTPYTVLTGSMRPHYPPGTLIVSKPVDPERIQIGDAITFQLKSGEPAVVTHRVIATRLGRDGKLEFLVKGDANSVQDKDPVRAVQVRGRLWYAVPYLGYANAILSGHQRQLATWAVGGMLAIYSALQLFQGFRQRGTAGRSGHRGSRGLRLRLLGRHRLRGGPGKRVAEAT
jgi:signal peptidase